MMKINQEELCMNCLDFDATWEEDSRLNFLPMDYPIEAMSWTTYYVCSNCGMENE